MLIICVSFDPVAICTKTLVLSTKAIRVFKHEGPELVYVKRSPPGLVLGIATTIYVVYLQSSPVSKATNATLSSKEL